MSVIDNIRFTFLYIDLYSMGRTWVYPESVIPYNIFRYIVKGKAEFCIDSEEILGEPDRVHTQRVQNVLPCTQRYI